MAATVAARMLFGPFRFGPVSVITPLNPEGFFGVAVTLLLFTRAATKPPVWRLNRRSAVLLALGIIAITAIALRRALGIYFLSDDFILVRIGHEWTAAAFRYSMTHGGGDGFFRPLGYPFFALDARWGGNNPVWWHASSLAIHSANAVLVLFLARRLGASALAAGFAGALFAVHGIHPEAVVWIAGRFDLVATFFLLAGLLLFTMAGERDRIALHIASLACFDGGGAEQGIGIYFSSPGRGIRACEAPAAEIDGSVFRARGDSVRLPLEPVRRNRRIHQSGDRAARGLVARFGLDREGGGSPAVDLALFPTELEQGGICPGPALGAARRGVYGGDPMAGGAGATGANAVARGGGDSDFDDPGAIAAGRIAHSGGIAGLVFAVGLVCDSARRWPWTAFRAALATRWPRSCFCFSSRRSSTIWASGRRRRRA